jgi:hypothetical protein
MQAETDLRILKRYHSRAQVQDQLRQAADGATQVQLLRYQQLQRRATHLSAGLGRELAPTQGQAEKAQS